MPARPWGIPRLQAKGPPGSGGHYFFSNNVLEGILYLISPQLGSKSVYFDNKQSLMVKHDAISAKYSYMRNRHSDLRNDCLNPKNRLRLNFLINFKKKFVEIGQVKLK